MKTIFGIKGFEISEYAVSANAILGIRDSGKTYTATEAAEELYDAGIPWIALDPIGVWHSLRIPGKGKGYPVVVAGGKHADLPLTVKNAGAIVRAAMEAGVSLVIDLFSMDLSKADWRRIVRETVEILLHENSEHGLRHIFIEEAAEFVPQRVQDGQVFAAVEKLVRMGGNSKLGCTLINQRSADINKSVLELCANVFVHRQKGKNTLLDLKKWLSMMNLTEQQEDKIGESLPDLKSGTCWALLNDIKHPVLLNVPTKNSQHPDRRAETAKGAKKREPVPADAFVEVMKAKLAPKQLAKPKPPAGVVFASLGPGKMNADKAEALERQHGRELLAAHAKGFQDGIEHILKGFRAGLHDLTTTMGGLLAEGHQRGLQAIQKEIQGRLAAVEREARRDKPKPVPVSITVKLTAADRKALEKPGLLVSTKMADTEFHGAPSISKPQASILASLSWWAARNHDAPSRVQVAMKARKKAAGGYFKTTASELSTLGLISYPNGATMSLTEEGRRVAPEPDLTVSVVDDIAAILNGPQSKLFRALLDGNTDRQDIGAAAGMEASGGYFKTTLSELSSWGIIYYPDVRSAALQEWVQ